MKIFVFYNTKQELRVEAMNPLLQIFCPTDPVLIMSYLTQQILSTSLLSFVLILKLKIYIIGLGMSDFYCL
jgi:hypothetical protein